MYAHKRSLNEILSVDVRFVAPLFQRPYVWDQEQNWEPLWLSLVEVFERRLAGEDPRPYFLGALVIDKVSGATGLVPCREIIDGQQRMTTLQIAMDAARKLLMAANLDHPARQLEKLTRNDIEEDTDERFKVWPTNLDRQAFRDVMDGVGTDTRMANAQTFFHECLSNWLQLDQSEAKDRAAALVAGFRNDLVFVAIDLDNDDDGQLIFETLNSLGTPLLPSDLVKNLLFREAISKKLDTNQLYSEYWEMFERDASYWRKGISIGRRERSRLDVFLQFYLTLKLAREPIASHQFREYRDAFRRGLFGGVKEALEEFSRFAKSYAEFDQTKEGQLGSLRHVLEILDASVPFPLILGIYVYVNDLNERSAMANVIESYLMRRFLCGLTTKQYNRTVADLISKLNQSGWSADNLRTALLGYEGNSSVWPDDGWVIWRQQERAAYGDIRSVGISFALSRIENSLRSSKTENGWNPRTPLTIEHILPQKWTEHWPLTEGSEEIRTARNELVNRIGNLTILTRKLNSAVSNSAWIVKRRHLNEHSVLLINSALASLDNWDDEAIKVRCLDLGQRFCQIWPR